MQDVPSVYEPPRWLGVSPDGNRVDNVTPQNRYDVNKRKPKLLVHLMDEDDETVITAVHIPNTRERPDVVMYRGEPFGAVDTTPEIPRYRRLMVLEATDIPTIGGPHDGSTEP